MWIPCRQRWVLWRLGRSLRRSDPHLAATLAIFARLTADEAIDSTEQADAVSERVRRGLARSLYGLRCAWIAVRRQFSLNRSVGFPPRAGKPGEA